jgi:CO/xanthine dehydrogenase FAD-binding subunit
MLPEFSSVTARTKEEAIGSLRDHSGSVLLAGGTDLLVRMRRGETHAHLVDITRVPELSGVASKNGRLYIGACTTHSAISRNADIINGARSLSIACGLVGSPQIRNMGTIGGNLVNASPAADSIPPLLVHEAQLTLESNEGTKTESLERFIVAPYKTVISATEILSSLVIESLKGYEEGYRRVAKRAAFAISRLSIAWAIKEEEERFADVRLAIGSCTPMPFRPRKVEAFLRGQKRERPVVKEAVNMVLDEIRTITGERPSFVYKLPVVRDLLLAILGGRQ